MTVLSVVSLLLTMAGGGHGCLPVADGRINAADVAVALPGLPAASYDVSLGHAPDPGYVRWWRGDELARLANRLGIADNTLRDFCVQRGVSSYTKEEILAALRAAVPSGVQVDLVEYCRTPVPKGWLSFEWRAIAPSTCGRGRPELLWRGQARFSPNRSAPFWVIVRLTTARTRVYSVSEIPAKTLLKSEDLRQERAPGSPLCAGVVESMESIEGMESIRRIPAGETLLSADLRMPFDVASGDLVRIQAVSESSRVEFTAKAVTYGRKGDMILIQDTAHRRTFRARVTGRRVADVDMEVLVASKPNRLRVERGSSLANPSVPR